MTRLLALLLVAAACTPAAAVARDRDRDGMRDRWERKHHVFGAKADPDADGLTNRYEFRRGTHPRRADSDRDGLRDPDELLYGWHPRKRDSDGDGVRDGDEGAGRVESVSGDSLSVRLANGALLTARISDDTIMICPPTEYDSTELDDESEAGYDPDAPADPSDPGEPDDYDDSQEDASEPFEDRCLAYFRPGALVHRATAQHGVYDRLELVQ